MKEKATIKKYKINPKKIGVIFSWGGGVIELTATLSQAKLKEIYNILGANFVSYE